MQHKGKKPILCTKHVKLNRVWRSPESLSMRGEIDAYSAGLMDGEGHISVNRHLHSTEPRRKRGTPHIEIGISNTNLRPLRLLLKAHGGKIRTQISKNPRWKDKYVWAASGATAHLFLSRVLPWLLIKDIKARAAIAIIQNTPPRGSKPTSRQKAVVKRAMRAFSNLKW